MTARNEDLLRVTSSTASDPSADGTKVTYKIADQPDEFDQIHELNHRTFAEEIPQHARNAAGRLVDRFHAENTYWIACRGTEVIAMVALRGVRPFSLDAKVPHLDRYLPSGCQPMEVRLLSVDARFRRSAVGVDLLRRAMAYALSEGFNLGIISGTTRQLKLYRHLGFVAFGPQVGPSDASYQPMYLTMRAMEQALHSGLALRSLSRKPTKKSHVVNLLPGPVQISSAVRTAFAAPAFSHRGKEFCSLMKKVRSDLCAMTGATSVQIIVGSGTLANGLVAAQLKRRPGRGLVIANGEFGERLIDEAKRHALDFTELRFDWRESWDFAAIEREVAKLKRGDWLWCVHHETSTGRLNPLATIKAVCAVRGIELCVDAMSSLGAVVVDLRGVAFATSTSGKALGALPGLGLVFHRHPPIATAVGIPAYLDLAVWADQESTPFTHSSNLLGALAAALEEATNARGQEIIGKASWVAQHVAELGLELVIPFADTGSGIITFFAPSEKSAIAVGEEMDRRGFLLSYRSAHLSARNWLQISLFSNPPREDLNDLLHELGNVVNDGRLSRRHEPPLALSPGLPSMERTVAITPL